MTSCGKYDSTVCGTPMDILRRLRRRGVRYVRLSVRGPAGHFNLYVMGESMYADREIDPSALSQQAVVNIYLHDEDSLLLDALMSRGLYAVEVPTSLEPVGAVRVNERKMLVYEVVDPLRAPLSTERYMVSVHVGLAVDPLCISLNPPPRQPMVTALYSEKASLYLALHGNLILGARLIGENLDLRGIDALRRAQGMLLRDSVYIKAPAPSLADYSKVVKKEEEGVPVLLEVTC